MAYALQEAAVMARTTRCCKMQRRRGHPWWKDEGDRESNGRVRGEIGEGERDEGANFIR